MESQTRYKWFIASLLGLAELGLLGGMVLAARGGLSWPNVFGFAWPILGVGQFSATADQDQTFAVGAAAALEVQSAFGEITVTGGPGHAIVVHAHKTGWGADQGAADAALVALKISLTQTGNAVTVKVERPSGLVLPSRGRTNGVDFTIEVPADAAVVAQTNFGDVQVTGATGGVDAGTSVGRASARQVGGSVVLHSDFGAVTLDNATVSSVRARSSSGSVTLNQVTASGAVELHSDFGAIDYQGGRAASLVARTSNGRVTLTGLMVDGAADARSDFGSLTVTQVMAGSYAVNSANGNISIDGAAGSVQASSDFGRVSVMHGAAVTLDLHSSNGAVTFSGSLGAGPHSLIGTLGLFFLTFIFIVVMRFIGYRETLHLAEKGLVRPERAVSGNGNGKDTLRWGIIVTAVGLALCLGLYPIGLLPGSTFPLGIGPWMIAGFLPTFFGLGMILIYVLTHEDQDDKSRPQAPGGPKPPLE